MSGARQGPTPQSRRHLREEERVRSQQRDTALPKQIRETVQRTKPVGFLSKELQAWVPRGCWFSLHVSAQDCTSEGSAISSEPSLGIVLKLSLSPTPLRRKVVSRPVNTGDFQALFPRVL